MTRLPLSDAPPAFSLRPSFSLRAPTFLVTHIGTSRHTPRHLLPRVRALLAPHVPAVCSPRAARPPAGAKPTAVGKARICVSKTDKYSIKRRKLLYFFVFFKVLFEKNPLNCRGEKIPQVFLSSCNSEAISRFSGGKMTPFRVFPHSLYYGVFGLPFLISPPFSPFVCALSLPFICRFSARLSVRSCALLCQRYFFVFTAFFYLYPPLPAQKESPACRGALLLFVCFLADGLTPPQAADAFPPTFVCRRFPISLSVEAYGAGVAARPNSGMWCQTTGISFSPSARDSSVGGASLSSPFI